MKLILMGTPVFAVSVAEALRLAGHTVLAVYTQPPKPAGRGQKLTSSPVQQWGEQHGIQVYTPKTLRNLETQATFIAHGADVAVVAAYGLLLPQAILDAPKYGCLNVHASLLPRWRGAAPIHRAIEAGDTQTGITIMQMDIGLDTGDMLLSKGVPILDTDTTASLHNTLARVGAEAIVEALASLSALNATAQPQNGITYAHKITKEEARLDWRKPAEVLERQVRAFYPFPGAWFSYREEVFKVLSASVERSSGRAGEVLDDTLLVACGAGALRFNVIQRHGKSSLPASEFLRGFPIPKGTIFEV